ncbi:MAG: ABC transporter ATP-binding protein, partial [Bacteroidia bacterium]|nr:ABC transporter ATP-binding protein [Bacteroidia bacterium]
MPKLAGGPLAGCRTAPRRPVPNRHQCALTNGRVILKTLAAAFSPTLYRMIRATSGTTTSGTASGTTSDTTSDTTFTSGRRVQSIISIQQLDKTYASGFQALKSVDLDIRRGEIFALLGPNGAGKTTLISIVCGIVNPSSGSVTVDGHDIVRDYRAARAKIGLVPQELSTDAFETVWSTVSFSRGLFGKPANPAYIEKV